jgi:hypothetical protein
MPRANFAESATFSVLIWRGADISAPPLILHRQLLNFNVETEHIYINQYCGCHHSIVNYISFLDFVSFEKITLFFKMPTQTYFSKYPSFPSDVTTAQLPRLSFSKILNYEKAESDAFFKACRTVGFFLLDFQGSSEGEDFLKKAEAMLDLMKPTLRMLMS